MVEVYLLYFLIIALRCKLCRICLSFCHLKTLESVYMHCELGKSLSGHFTSHRAYYVTKVSRLRTPIFAFYLVVTLMNCKPFLPLPTLLFK